MNLPAARPDDLLFLSWESPWPSFGGATLRTMGLLRQLSETFRIHLVILSREPLSEIQEAELQSHVSSITRVAMAGTTLTDKLHILARAVIHGLPYHCARLDLSFRRAQRVLRQVRSFPGVVYASLGHWGTLVHGEQAPNWILDQQNADVDFWRVYATQTTNPWLKVAALANWRFADSYFPGVYSSVGRIISVCEEDRELTIALAPDAQVDVVENGVDCSYYSPEIVPGRERPRLLFTGTSAPRNLTALRQFTRDVWPTVQQEVSDCELLVAGNFRPKAQAEFNVYDNVRFTGKVADMRPYFNKSDLFIAPFRETHGSKLKIAEAMAMAMPIVSTREGIRGFPLVHEESVMIANNSQEFATYAIRLLMNPNRRATMGQKARQVAVSTIDWTVLGKRLTKIVEDTFKRSTGKGS